MPPRRKSRAWDVAARDVPRDIWPSGRVKVRLGTVPADETRRRRAALERLRGWHAWDVIHAVSTDLLPLTRVVATVQERGEAGLVELRASLTDAAAGALPSFREAADDYLLWYERERRAKSLKQVRSRLKRFCEQGREGGTVGEVRIDHLTKDDIERALHSIGGASATQEAIRLAVSGLYSWWTGNEAEDARTGSRPVRFAANPAGNVPRKERRTRVTTASPTQMVALFAAAEVYQAAILRPLAHLGLREDELVHTRLHDDLDIRDWIWRIQPRAPDARCPCPDCQGPKGWAPKSKRSVRTLEVPAEPAQLRGAILRYMEIYPCEPGDFAFRNPRTSRVWDPSRFDADFKGLCVRAGVRYGAKVPGGITPHVIRHTCATELLRSGVDSAVIAALLGDTLQTVATTYLHVTAGDVAAAITRGPEYEV